MLEVGRILKDMVLENSIGKMDPSMRGNLI